MGSITIFILAFLVVFARGIPEEEVLPSKPGQSPKHLLRNLILHQPRNDTFLDHLHTEDHSRIKRQIRRRYPIPIMVGGGRYPSGPRGGFGGRGGGRGFGGRGFGGRGIGGRGIGGRGGGIGGRGGRG